MDERKELESLKAATAHNTSRLDQIWGGFKLFGVLSSLFGGVIVAILSWVVMTLIAMKMENAEMKGNRWTSTQEAAGNIVHQQARNVIADVANDNSRRLERIETLIDLYITEEKKDQ